MADLDQRASRLTDARAHLREALALAARIGDGETMMDCLDYCGRLCAAAQYWAEAATLWTAYLTLLGKDPALGQDRQEDQQARRDGLQEAAKKIGPARMRAAGERGASMTLATAAEFVNMLTEHGSPALSGPGAPPDCLASASGNGK